MVGHLEFLRKKRGLRRGLWSGQYLFEGELHEAVERRAVALDAGPEQSPFVGVEKKRRDVPGIPVGRHGTLGLRVGDRDFEVVRPPLEERQQAFTDDGALICELRAEVAEEASALELRLGEGVVQRLEMRPQSLQRGHGLVEQYGAAR